jgi:hypothetical protein
MKKKCTIEGCINDRKYANGLCGMHWVRVYRSGIDQTIRRKNGTGSIGQCGYVVHTIDYARIGEHVRLAEKALGKPLPVGAIVHHVDENPFNNSPENLVICPDQKYHSLIHQRTRSVSAGFPAHWRKCWVCHAYDDPSNLYIHGQVAHKSCLKLHNAKYRKEKVRRHASL